eukprot:scaffold10712_cov56-Attheya_sp.AAC.1
MKSLLLFSFPLLLFNLSFASYMVAFLCAEKGSCQSLQQKQALLEEDSCPACKDLHKWMEDSYFATQSVDLGPVVNYASYASRVRATAMGCCHLCIRA